MWRENNPSESKLSLYLPLSILWNFLPSKQSNYLLNNINLLWWCRMKTLTKAYIHIVFSKHRSKLNLFSKIYWVLFSNLFSNHMIGRGVDWDDFICSDSYCLMLQWAELCSNVLSHFHCFYQLKAFCVKGVRFPPGNF